jgi:hypothetical protein
MLENAPGEAAEPLREFRVLITALIAPTSFAIPFTTTWSTWCKVGKNSHHIYSARYLLYFEMARLPWWRAE